MKLKGIVHRLSRLRRHSLRGIAIGLLNPTRRRVAAGRRAAEELAGGPIPYCGKGTRGNGPRVGILDERAGFHVYNVLACQELGLGFVVLPLDGTDWLETIRREPADFYLAWPSTNLSLWKDVYEERLRILASVTQKLIVPSLDEIWLFESKRRVREWLRANGVPHPATEVFLDEESAVDFVGACSLPIVCKLNAGAASHGVFVLRERHQARRLVRRAFGRGLSSKHRDRREREWGIVLLQEYVPHEFEWRIVRVGSDFLCRRKWKVGDFASGAGALEYATPGLDLLDFADHVTSLGRYSSMALDVFELPPGTGGRRFLVNEMQCLVGALPLHPSVHRGRWRRVGGAWQFEAGDFYRNACANLRVQYALEKAGLRQPDPWQGATPRGDLAS